MNFSEEEYIESFSEAAVEEAVDETDGEPTLSEVERRLEIATYFKAAMKGGFFETNTEISLVVEKEIYNFCRSRLEVLLGISQPSVTETEVIAKSPFTEDEAKVLKAVAAKLLSKTAEVKAAPPPIEPQVKKNRIPQKSVTTQPEVKQSKQAKPVAKKPSQTSRKKYKTVVNDRGEEVQMDVTPQPRMPGAKPMPSPAEMEQIMQMQAAHAATTALSTMPNNLQRSVIKHLNEEEGE